MASLVTFCVLEQGKTSDKLNKDISDIGNSKNITAIHNSQFR